MSLHKLFPYVLVRVAGGSLNDWKKTELNETLKIYSEITEKTLQLQKTQTALSNALHGYISTVKDKKTRFLLIQLRRDIHNSKSVAYFSPENLRSLPNKLQALLEKYSSLTEEITLLHKQGEKLFIKESNSSRIIFSKLLQQPNFRNGILLSSSTLIGGAKIYDPKKYTPKLERSLIKYLTRMYTKPSPFSTFTQLGIGTFTEEPNIKSNKMFSRVQLNHVIFQYLLGLLIQNKTIRKQLTVKLNFTIEKKDGQFVFHTNNFNREAFQRINVTPALEIIISFINQQNLWTYDELVTRLQNEKFTSIKRKELEKYIDNLLSFGFLEFDFGISGMAPDWDKQLITKLTPLQEICPEIKDLIKTLQDIRSAAERYQIAETKVREELLDDAYTKIRETCLLLHKAAKLPKSEHITFKNGYEPKKHRHMTDKVFRFRYTTKFMLKKHSLWYEDTGVTNPISLPPIQKQLHSLQELLSRMGRFDSCTEKQYDLADFFKMIYGTDTSVDLLEFYEKVSQKEKDEKKSKSKSVSDLVKNRRQENQTLLDTFAPQINDQMTSDEITISKNHISHIQPENETASYGAFFQIAQHKNAYQLILNAAVPGYGKLFSRFLPLFPEEITGTIRKWNKPLSKELLYAEATDASIFNANHHPALVSYEIRMPGGYNSLPQKQQILLTDIEVAYDTTTNRLKLLDKTTKKQIYVFDFGFQGPDGRSKLYSFLTKFTPGDHYKADALMIKINELVKKRFKKGEIVMLPRIVYDNSIILQRKSWHVPASALPKRENETDWEYFHKVNSWKDQYNIPEEMFVTEGEEKPQYISYSNPLLLQVFEKIIEKTKKELIITEMSPLSDELESRNGDKKVSEFFVQW